MAREIKHVQGAGHPWDERPGFDHLDVVCDTEAERDAVVAEAQRKFWKAWIVGFEANPAKGAPDRPAALLYKPSGIRVDWQDGPDRPHPGCRDGVEISQEEYLAWQRDRRSQAGAARGG